MVIGETEEVNLRLLQDGKSVKDYSLTTLFKSSGNRGIVEKTCKNASRPTFVVPEAAQVPR